MGSELAVVHLAHGLMPGGCCRVMENLARLGTDRGLHHVLGGMVGGEAFVGSLRARGVDAHILGERFEHLDDVLSRHDRFVTVIHRSGQREARWDVAVRELRRRGCLALVERNVFGYRDDGPTEREIDLACCNSLHTLWRHWTASGRPSIDEYLHRHRVLPNAVLLPFPEDEVKAARARVRERLGIPEDAFVIGSITRPDPMRLDAMMPAIMSRLVREIENVYFLARSYPDSLARNVQTSLGARFTNLPMTSDLEDLAETYAAFDVLAHFSSMGERLTSLKVSGASSFAQAGISGLRPHFLSASRITSAPRSFAGTVFRDPPKEPTAVLAPLTITTFDIVPPCQT